MTRITSLIFALLLFPVAGLSQTAATLHVFPQVADGLFADGSFYQSVLLATATTSSSTSCQYRIYGSAASRIDGSGTFNLQGAGAFTVVPTYGNLFPLATGYATLTCDQPVSAVLGYLYMLGQKVLSGAAVFSSPSVSRAQLVVNQTASATALAIANNSDTDVTYQVSMITASGQTAGSANVTVPARSNLARFAHDLVALPANFIGRAVVTAPGAAQFGMIGLNYFGAVFFTQPATALP